MRGLALTLAAVATLVAGCRVEPSLQGACAPDGSCPAGCTCVAELGQCLPNSGSSCAEAAASTLTLDGGVLPPALEQTGYAASLQASGGTPPYAFSLVAGALPRGLGLSDAGVLSGTLADDPGTYAFTVEVRDGMSPPQRAEAPLQLEVQAFLRLAGPFTLATATSSAPYTETLNATGGTKAYRFAMVDGGTGLPAELQLAEDGTLSGTAPNVVLSGAKTYTFRVQVEDTSVPPRQVSPSTLVSLTVEPSPTGILTRALPTAQLRQAYRYQLRSAGTTGVEWTASNLPAGLTLDTITGLISGTPQERVTRDVTITTKEPGLFGNTLDTLQTPLTVN